MTVAIERRCTDQVILDQWHPLTAVAEVHPNVVGETMLLDQLVSFVVTDSAEPMAWLSDPATSTRHEFDLSSVPDPLPVMLEYGYLWTSLGAPPERLFDIPIPNSIESGSYVTADRFLLA